MTQQYLTAQEAAAQLRCHERTIRRMIGDGRLPAMLIGGRYLIDPDDLPTPAPLLVDEFAPVPRRRRPEPAGRFRQLAARIEASR